MKKLILISATFMISCSINKKNEENQNSTEVEINSKNDNQEIAPLNREDDSIMRHYIYIANLNNEIPEGNPYIEDIESIKNIDRPSRSYIKESTFSTSNLFGVWGRENEPVSDFRIDAKTFDAADYFGNGNMPYIIYKDSIIIFYNDFISKGKIVYNSSDSLAIKWKANEEDYIQGYSRWK